MERPREEDNWVLEVYEVEVEENEGRKGAGHRPPQGFGEGGKP